MSLMWIRLRPCVSTPIKHPPEIPQNFTPCARQLIISSRPSVYRFGGLDRLQMKLVCRALLWRQTGRLLNRTALYRWVCLPVFHLRLSLPCESLQHNCPFSRDKHKPATALFHLSAEYPKSCGNVHLGEEEERLWLLLIPCFGTGTNGHSGFLLQNMLHNARLLVEVEQKNSGALRPFYSCFILPL